MRERWREVTIIHLLIFTACWGAFCWLVTQQAHGFLPGLDHVNLWIHRAGHLLAELIVPGVALYAGMIAQLLVPAVATVAFWKEAETIPCAVCGIWFSENLLNLSAYIADAGKNTLPVVGGNVNEWEEIFKRWGTPATMNTSLADWFWLGGWTGIVFAWFWVCRRWWRSR